MDLVKEIEAADAEAVNVIAIANTVAITEEETMIVAQIAIGVANRILEEVVDMKTCNMVLDGGMKKEVDTIRAEIGAILIMTGTRDMVVQEEDMTRVIKETGVDNEADMDNKADTETRAVMVPIAIGIRVMETRAIGVSKVDMVNKVNMETKVGMAIKDTVPIAIGIKVTGAVSKVDMEIRAGDMVDQEDLNPAREHMVI